MDKEDVVHIYNRTPLSNKKRSTTDTHNIDKSQNNYMKLKKPKQKRNRPYDSIHRKF